MSLTSKDLLNELKNEIVDSFSTPEQAKTSVKRWVELFSKNQEKVFFNFLMDLIGDYYNEFEDKFAVDSFEEFQDPAFFLIQISFYRTVRKLNANEVPETFIKHISNVFSSIVSQLTEGKTEFTIFEKKYSFELVKPLILNSLPYCSIKEQEFEVLTQLFIDKSDETKLFYTLVFEKQGTKTFASKIPETLHDFYDLFISLNTEIQVELINRMSQENLKKLVSSPFVNREESSEIILSIIKNINPNYISNEECSTLASNINGKDFTKGICSYFEQFDFNFKIPAKDYDYTVDPLFFMKHLEEPSNEMPPELISETIRNTDPLLIEECFKKSKIKSEALETDEFWIRALSKVEIGTYLIRPFCYNVEDIVQVLKSIILKNDENNINVYIFAVMILNCQNKAFALEDIVEILQNKKKIPAFLWRSLLKYNEIYELVHHYEKYKEILSKDFIRHSTLLVCDSNPYPFPDIHINPFQENTQQAVLDIIKDDETSTEDLTAYQLQSLAYITCSTTFNKKKIPNVYGVTEENAIPIIALSFRECNLDEFSLMKFDFYDRNPLDVIKGINHKLSEFELICFNSIFKDISESDIAGCFELVEDMLSLIINQRSNDWVDGLDAGIWKAITYLSHEQSRQNSFFIENEDVIVNWILTKFTYIDYDKKLIIRAFSEKAVEKLTSLFLEHNKAAVGFFNCAEKFEIYKDGRIMKPDADFMNQHSDLIDARSRMYIFQDMSREEIAKVDIKVIYSVIDGLSEIGFSEKVSILPNLMNSCFEHLQIFDAYLFIEKDSDAQCYSLNELKRYLRKKRFIDYEEGMKAVPYLLKFIPNRKEAFFRIKPKKFPKANKLEKQLAEYILRKAHETPSEELLYTLLTVEWSYPQVFMELEGITPKEVGDMILDICETWENFYYGVILLYRLFSCPTMIDDFVIPMIRKMITLSDNKLLPFLIATNLTMQENCRISLLITVEYINNWSVNDNFEVRSEQIKEKLNDFISIVYENFAEINEEVYSEIINSKLNAKSLLYGHYASSLCSKEDIVPIECDNLLCRYLKESLMNEYNEDDCEEECEEEYEEEEFEIEKSRFVERDEIIALVKEFTPQDPLIFRLDLYYPVWVEMIIIEIMREETGDFSKEGIDAEQFELFKDMYRDYLTVTPIGSNLFEEVTYGLVKEAIFKKDKISLGYFVQNALSPLKAINRVVKEYLPSNQLDLSYCILLINNVSKMLKNEEPVDEELGGIIVEKLLFTDNLEIINESFKILNAIAKNPSEDFIILIKRLLINSDSSSVANIIGTNPKILEATSDIIKKKIARLYESRDFENNFLIDVIKYIPSIICDDRKKLLILLEESIKKMENFNIIPSLCNFFASNPPAKRTTDTDNNDTELKFISSKLFATDPEFWIIIDNYYESFTKIFNNNNTSITSQATEFLKKIPKLIPLNQKVSIFYQNISNVKLQREKIYVRRSHILEDSLNSLKPIRYPVMLNVSFFDEKGLDAGGVLKDWLTAVTEEILNENRGLFELRDGGNYQPSISNEFNYDSLACYDLVGKIIGIAINSKTHINMHLTLAIYKMLLGYTFGIKEIKNIDEALFNSVQWILSNDVSECDLTFTDSYERFGQITSYELIRDGANIPVTNENKEKYVNRLIFHRIVGKNHEKIEAIAKGFATQVNRNYISIFTPKELEYLICGFSEINIDDLEANIELEKPYKKDSFVIKCFFSAIRKWTNKELGKLLLFWTGSPIPPLLGFESLNENNKMKIFPSSRKDGLPESHTCFNILMLPMYESEEELNRKLKFAVTECNTFEFI